jgi:hypothetical protein
MSDPREYFSFLPKTRGLAGGERPLAKKTIPENKK